MNNTTPMIEITNKSPYGAGTPKQIGFTASFRSEYDGWRKKRPQWLALCKAIRNEANREELYGLASEAGATINEVWDMQTLSRRGRDAAGEAKQLDSAEKALAAAQKRMEQAEKVLNKKGLSMNDQAAAAEELEAASFAFEKARIDVIGPRQAFSTLSLARSENLA
jgi:hypothetical protein